MAINFNQQNPNNPQGQLPNQQTQQSFKPKSTGFTNIQRVLGANKNNKLGQAVTQGVQGTVQGVKSNLQQEVQKNKQIADNYNSQIGQQQHQANQVISQVNQPDPNADLSQIANANQELFQNVRSSNYTGPQELGNIQKLQQQAGDVEQLGKQIAGSNREGLLQRYVGGDRYTGGQRRLDNLLLGQTGQKELNQARRDTMGIDDSISQANSEAANRFMSNLKYKQDVAGSINQQLGQSQEKINSDIQNVLNNLQSDNQFLQTKDKAVRDYLSQRQKTGAGEVQTQTMIDPVDQAMVALERAGVSAGQYKDQLMKALNAGLDPRELVNASLKTNLGQNITKEGAMTGQQASQLNALSRLSGDNSTTYNKNIEATKGGFNFDINNIQKNIAEQEAYNQANAEEKARMLADRDARTRKERMAAENTRKALYLLNPALGASADMLSGDFQKSDAYKALQKYGGMDKVFELTGNTSNALNRAMSGEQSLDSALSDTTSNLLKDIANRPGQYINLSPGMTAEDAYNQIKSIGSNPGDAYNRGDIKKGIESVGNTVSDAVSNVTCHLAGTMIRLIDNKFKSIENIKLGDMLYLGGKVTALGSSVANEFYDYKNEKVTGEHAVFEDGKFIRVKNSKDSKLNIVNNEIIVYIIVTEKHLMVTNNIIWADYAETPFAMSLTDDQRLTWLNDQVDRNKELEIIQKDLNNEIAINEEKNRISVFKPIMEKIQVFTSSFKYFTKNKLFCFR